MKNNMKRATVAIVPVLGVEGLMMPNSEFKIGFSQLANLQLVPPNRSLKQLKALTGLDFPSHEKVVSELNSKPINVIGLRDFELLLAKLDRMGNKPAQDLRDSLVGTGLEKLFCDAFGIKFETEEFHKKLEERLKGKLARREFTDAIKDYIDRTPLSFNESKWMYANASDKLNKLLFGKTAKKLCEQYQCPKDQLRDQFNSSEIIGIRRLEEYAMNLVDNWNTHPVEAIEKAYDFWKNARLPQVV